MSGGSYQYEYSRLALLADQIRARTREQEREPLSSVTIYDRATKGTTRYDGEPAIRIGELIAEHRYWLCAVLDAMSEACRDVEWVDSSDYGIGDEVAAIRRITEWLSSLPPGIPEIRGGGQ